MMMLSESQLFYLLCCVLFNVSRCEYHLINKTAILYICHMPPLIVNLSVFCAQLKQIIRLFTVSKSQLL